MPNHRSSIIRAGGHLRQTLAAGTRAKAPAPQVDGMRLALRAALGFQFREQLLDTVFFFKRRDAVLEIVAGDF
jgi:hypothetical protein